MYMFIVFLPKKSEQNSLVSTCIKYSFLCFHYMLILRWCAKRIGHFHYWNKRCCINKLIFIIEILKTRAFTWKNLKFPSELCRTLFNYNLINNSDIWYANVQLFAFIDGNELIASTSDTNIVHLPGIIFFQWCTSIGVGLFVKYPRHLNIPDWISSSQFTEYTHVSLSLSLS